MGSGATDKSSVTGIPCTSTLSRDGHEVCFEAELEQALFERPDSVHGLPAGPRRFEIEANLMRQNGPLAWRRRLAWFIFGFPYMQAMRRDIRLSFTSVTENPAKPKSKMTMRLRHDFETRARAYGVGAIGYIELPEEAIFQEKAVLFTHAIVLMMEMDAERIAKAPSRATYRLVMESYYDLGRAVTRLVNFLRQHGYAAQGGHPLNGVALYPLIAQRAGLGWMGTNGLLISPQFGPRHRLAAIYTTITDLPVPPANEHAWISEFCQWCGQCIRKCPSQAIYDEPIKHETGRETHIDVNRCFPIFAEQYGCSLCIKVCPFNTHSYEKIRHGFFKRMGRVMNNEYVFAGQGI